MTSQVKASHILVKTEDEAKNLYKELTENGKDFAELAMQYSSCPSGQNGGDLGFSVKVLWLNHLKMQHFL